ncbi:MAG: hypothetical protein WCD43_04640 [Candidatus Acidiferrales bacterium]
MVEELTVRTNSLKAMMFDHDGLAKQAPNHEGKKCWAGEMDDICPLDFPNEVHEAGLANDTIRQLQIIHTSRGSLRE